ncbi:MAG: NAD-dependent epimerase/dehydratase family protein [Acidobacteria bacterium]|nr:NAD-dependent epimerase/dehydratase family protein [Acidobacteriota bacterium]MCG2815351.1 NAD-dependent epimerase/dehydratase family protein [Candidatus Aminicenantes bacterium]
MSTVLISGARGFIAGRLAETLRAAGFHVLGLSRKAEPLPHFHQVFSAFLLNPIQGLFAREHVDAFIHCAYYAGEDEFAINVNGTRLWSEQAERNGVKRQIFFSSVSAAAPAEGKSPYGRAKHVLEEWFIRHNETVLRLGLVVGPGGLYQRMVDMVRTHRILPLPDGGRAGLYLTKIDWLSEIVRDALLGRKELSAGRVWNLFQPEQVTLAALLREIRKETNSRCLFIPVPSRLLLAAVTVAEKCPFLKLQVNRNNLIGLRRNDRLNLHSDL